MNQYLIMSAGVVVFFAAVIILCRGKGFWSDTEGLSLSEFVGLVATPIWAFVAVKMAFSADISAVQVDFFLALTYPVLLILGGTAVQKIGLPTRGGLRSNTNELVNNSLANEKLEGGVYSGQSNRY